MSRLYEHYIENVRPALMKKLGYKNIMQVPKLEKIVLNIGVGDARENPRHLERAQEELTLIACQKALVAKARKSVANFRIRKGMPNGVFVTIRGKRMYHFLDKLISIALPRVRDFRGVSEKAFDGRGNYNLGVREQLIFPEVPYDKVEKVRGLNISIVTTAKTDREAYELLKELGMPFRKRGE